MRKTSRTGPFIMVLLFNILINFRLTIPGWILLVLSFIIPQYIKWWYAMIYFGAFLLYMLIWMLILWGIGTWARSAPPYPPVENKNPYSAKNADQPWNKNPYSVKNSAPSLSDHAEPPDR